jgi:hypothetical protein
MLQNMPLLNRVLGTAALASVITSIAHEPPIEPRVRASHGKGNTASREVISAAVRERRVVRLLVGCPWP